MATESGPGTAALTVENVGGIDRTEVTFSAGVTVLAGRNATNRTSLLRAVMAACGSDDATIKGDADEARVELRLDGETYTRTLTRRGDAVGFGGDPYLDDPTVADLFAFLLESNEARRAVARGDDLREVIMRPVDTDRIESEIDRLVDERGRLEAEIEEIDSLKGELPELEAERSRLADRLEEKRAALAEKEAELEALDADVEASRGGTAAVEETLAELREKRSSLDDVRYDLETERETIEELRAERERLEGELADLPDAPADDDEDLGAQLDRLRARKRDLEAEINELQGTIRFNEEALEGADREVFRALAAGSDGGTVTDQLLEGDAVTCWTCGATVDTEQVESTLERLRELRRRKVSEANDLDGEIDDLAERRDRLAEHRRERERIEGRLRAIDDEVEASERTVEALGDRRGELSAAVEALDEEVEASQDEASEDDAHAEVLAVHKAANRLEYELGRLESDLDRVEDEIATVEGRIAERDDLAADREAVRTEIEELRTTIERTETEAIEAFNGHMETVLDLLEYGNLERVWLERVEREVREGRRTATETAFELHVVRRTDAGSAYEDTVAHLSESEREVTGLVFALAGYLVHDVHERVPVMLLDSVEAIDAGRIAALVDYFEDYGDFLVVALLPEDAARQDERHDRVTAI